VISRIADVELIPRLQEAGIKVVQPELATAMALEGAIRYPTAFDVLLHQTENIEVTEVKVKNEKLIGARLAEVRLPGDALILSLKRENTVIVPDGETVLQSNDQLGLIGSPSSMPEAISMLKG
jgi:Trk K+ transport system NAD-binding subunit